MTSAATIDRWTESLQDRAASRVIDREIESVGCTRFDVFCAARGFDSAELNTAEFAMLRDLYAEQRSGEPDFDRLVAEEMESE
jgi:hypothetical protein